MVEAYPLQWPQGWTRTTFRRAGDFTCTLATARDGILKQIRMLGGKHPIISSNLMLKQDGLPYANQRQPNDPGIAVYFELRGKAMCFACDRFQKVESNMRAIEKTIEALRGIERWGASDMMERAFTGFAAIEDQRKQWHVVLGVPAHASMDQVRTAYRRARGAMHPDREEGDGELFHAIQQAWQEFCKERGIEA